ncbi:hypothetical protein F383_30165 [Gossypium arboreum]|uniref:Uncharacterized protein n=1 Tax=Gossypium arboreum TaxID=29729 RepID=A0A0B0PHK4_GOSAR|nr:hypothetical protein F383_30165 [Gossypium arboreum]
MKNVNMLASICDYM